MTETGRSFASSVRRLMRRCDRAALGTVLVGAGGGPYVSLVMVAAAPDASPLLYLSRLAEHTRNILADPRVALLFDGTSGLEVPLAGSRATVLGRAQPAEDELLLARYIRYHPDAADYRQLGDFRLWRVEVERAHMVAGFGRVGWVDGSDLRLSGPSAQECAVIEDELRQRLMGAGAERIERLVARHFGRMADTCQLAGIDPEGLDLIAGHKRLRIDFPEPVSDAGALRARLAALIADQPPASG